MATELNLEYKKRKGGQMWVEVICEECGRVFAQEDESLNTLCDDCLIALEIDPSLVETVEETETEDD